MQNTLLTGNLRRSAIALHFTNGMIQVCSFVFVNALFLSSYPSSWLVYFFAGQTVIDLILSFFMATLLARYNRAYVIIILISSALITGLFCYAKQFNAYYTPLFFSFFLLSAGQLSNIISWNSVRAAVDLIELKDLSPAITSARSIGDVLTSITFVALIAKFNITFIPYVMIVLLMLASACCYLLKPIQEPSNKPAREVIPFRYPLYRQMFVTLFLVVISYTLIDYCLRYKLSVSLDRAQIAQFMAIFNGTASAISSLCGFFGIKLFINYLGVSSLLFTLPAYWLVTAIVAMLFPSLSSISIMALGKYIFYYSIFSTGRELVLNILPSTVRIYGQFLIKSLASPIAGGVATLLLFYLSHHLSIPFIIFLVIMINVFLLCYIIRIKKSYVTTLKDAIYLRRFNLDETSEENSKLIKNVASQALDSNEPDKITLGFVLLSHFDAISFPQKLLRHIDSDNADIRIQAIQSIARYHAKEALPYLLDRFSKETKPDVKWWLLDTIADLHYHPAIALGRKLLNDPAPEVQAGAIRMLLTQGDCQDVATALQKLQLMLNNDDVRVRRNAARLLRHVTIGNIVKEIKRLIGDKDNTVSAGAIEAAAILNKSELSGVIIQRVLNGGVFHAAQKALSSLGVDTVFLFSDLITKSQQRTEHRLNLLITLLGSMPGLDAENYLMKLAQEPDIILSGIATKELAHRVQRMPISPQNLILVKKAIKNEYTSIFSLNALALKYQQNDYIVREVQSRILLAKQKLLLWLAIYSNLKEVFGIIYIILHSHSKLERAKAIELFISILHQKELAQIILDIFHDHLAPHDLPLTDDHQDAWLEKVIHFATHQETGGAMFDMQKVFTLREVELFKQLSGEALLIIAEDTEVIDIANKQVIFTEGDSPSGLYIVMSGEVEISKQGKVIATLKGNDFFGELALLDNETRTASAIASRDGVLLFLKTETFNRITEDQPEVLRVVVQVIMRYLRNYLKTDAHA
jgi:hypothetical protein